MARFLMALLALSAALNGFLIWQKWGREPESDDAPVAAVKPGACAPASDPGFRFFPGPSAPFVMPSGRAVAPPPANDSRLTLDHPVCQVAVDRFGRHSDAALKQLLEFFGALRDSKALEDSFEENLRQIEDIVGQQTARETTLRKEYGELYFKNAKEFILHTTTNPPNFPSMLAIAKRHFKEEDALVQKLFSEERMYAFRAFQLKRRVELVAILSHFMKVPTAEILSGVDTQLEAPKPTKPAEPS